MATSALDGMFPTQVGKRERRKRTRVREEEAAMPRVMQKGRMRESADTQRGPHCLSQSIPRCRLSPETFITPRRPLGIVNVFDPTTMVRRFEELGIHIGKKAAATRLLHKRMEWTVGPGWALVRFLVCEAPRPQEFAFFAPDSNQRVSAESSTPFPLLSSSSPKFFHLEEAWHLTDLLLL